MPKFQPSMTVRAFGDDLIACIVDIEHMSIAQSVSRARRTRGTGNEPRGATGGHNVWLCG